MALNFPNDPASVNYSWVSPNGINYYYDVTAASWILVSSQSVNKDYVDSRDDLQLRRDGTDFMYGDLVIKQTNSQTSEDKAVLYRDGALYLTDTNKIFFGSGYETSGTISYGDPNNAIVNFETDRFVIRKHIEQFTIDDSTIVKLINDANSPEVLILDIDHPNYKSQKTEYTINIPNSSKANLAVKSNDTLRFNVNGDGQVDIINNDKYSFVVNNAEQKHDIPVFRVDAQTHKIYGSPDYNQGLVNQSKVVTSGSGNRLQYFEEENLLVTKGYVDRFQVKPGMNICADKEEDAEIGGFWRKGSSIFIRVG